MIQVVLPMAGEGLRFQNDYPNSYKPFIEIKGRYLFQYALDSLSELESLSLIFILRHDEVSHYSDIIKKEYPKSQIKILTSKTRGALETVLQAKELLIPDNKLLILDSDLTFRSSQFLTFINESSEKDNGFPTFKSTLPKYSYCEQKEGVVSKTAEKEVISNDAIIGAYFFGSASNFLELAESIVTNKVPKIGEYYISPMYNNLIKAGHRVSCFDVTSYQSLGTPEELKNYLRG